MEIILLERISRLGGVGDVVDVKNGYARNYLIPQNKALRANKANKEAFETQRGTLEKQNAERRSEAEAQAKTLEGIIVTVVRQASDDGKLYGSVAVRDVSDAMEAEGHTIDRRLIDLNTAIKNLGVYDVTINLHPEVAVIVRVHVARNADSPLPEELLEEEVTEDVPVVEAAAEEVGTEADETDVVEDDQTEEVATA